MPIRPGITAVAAALLVAGLIAPGATIAGSPAPSRSVGSFAAAGRDGAAGTGRVLVRWTGARTASASAATGRVNAIANAAQGTAQFVRVTASGSAVYDLGKPLGSNAAAILARLGRVPGVTSVEPDIWMTHTGLPNDTYTTSLWGLIDGSLSTAPDYGINAPGVWRTTTGVGVRVAVIDTGILFNHPDLLGQTVPGYDLISASATARDGDGRDPDASDRGDWTTSADGCGTPANSSWHGTHVAGTIAAKANNSIGVFGGAPGVKILPVRVLGKCGGFLSDVADGITWASGGTVPGVLTNTTNVAKVLSLSLGGSSMTCEFDMQSAINGARSRGSVVIVAAGNSNSNASGFTPANCAGVIAVAAINQQGKRASFSNWGPIVDIAGPGTAIKSTLSSATQSPNGVYTYVDYEGTSMATPHVSLTAALLLAADSSLTPDEIEALLEGSARPFPKDSSLNNCRALPHKCGAGIVSARAAMELLLGTN